MKDYYDYIDNQDIVEKNPEPGAGIGVIDTIEFRHVSYQYEDSDQYALKDISFRLEKNSKNAVIGLNGAGKSTLLKLLCGVYEPSSGEVLLNGRDMRELPREDVRRLMSVFFQDYYIFPFTIRENVTAFAEDGERSGGWSSWRRGSGAKGRHDELLKGNEKYRSLYQKYAEKYLGEGGANASIS